MASMGDLELGPKEISPHEAKAQRRLRFLKEARRQL
jgi:hypothetical protein